MDSISFYLSKEARFIGFLLTNKEIGLLWWNLDQKTADWAENKYALPLNEK